MSVILDGIYGIYRISNPKNYVNYVRYFRQNLQNLQNFKSKLICETRCATLWFFSRPKFIIHN
jgi:hypothetical protein